MATTVTLELYGFGNSKSGKAMLVGTDPDRRKADAWLPLSQIDWCLDGKNPKIIVVTMPEWLAKDKGLI